MATVSQAVFGRLSTYAGLAALVGARIYPGIAPQEQALPCVAFLRTDEDQDEAFSADADILETLFDVVSVGSTYDECEAVHEQVRKACRRFSGTVAGVVVRDMLLRGGNGPVGIDDPPSYEATQRVAVRYTEV